MASPKDEIGFEQNKRQETMTDPDSSTIRKLSIISGRYDPESLEIDQVAEKKLVRKLDLHIVPMVMLLYLLVRDILSPMFSTTLAPQDVFVPPS